MYIQRHIQPVVERIAKRKPVLVLTGARQVGKSTMLKEVYHHLNYVALNRPLVRQSAVDNPSLFFEAHRPPIIVDEIQKAAALFDYIKDIVDAKRAKRRICYCTSMRRSAIHPHRLRAELPLREGAWGIRRKRGALLGGIYEKIVVTLRHAIDGVGAGAVCVREDARQNPRRALCRRRVGLEFHHAGKIHLPGGQVAVDCGF